MTATNMCSNFCGLRYSPPLNIVSLTVRFVTQQALFSVTDISQPISMGMIFFVIIKSLSDVVTV